jgi:hypothetical protein
MGKRKLTCFVCLDTVRGDGTALVNLLAHLIKQHGWTKLVGNHPKFNAAAFFWRFQYVSRCLVLLQSSQSREAYLADVALIAPFDPLVFPPGYSVDATKDQMKETAAHWKSEFERVAKEWIKDQKSHPVIGMSLLLFLPLS